MLSKPKLFRFLKILTIYKYINNDIGIVYIKIKHANIGTLCYIINLLKMILFMEYPLILEFSLYFSTLQDEK